MLSLKSFVLNMPYVCWIGDVKKSMGAQAESLEEFIQGLSDALVIRDQDGRVDFSNAAFNTSFPGDSRSLFFNELKDVPCTHEQGAVIEVSNSKGLSRKAFIGKGISVGDSSGKTLVPIYPYKNFLKAKHKPFLERMFSIISLPMVFLDLSGFVLISNTLFDKLVALPLERLFFQNILDVQSQEIFVNFLKEVRQADPDTRHSCQLSFQGVCAQVECRPIYDKSYFNQQGFLLVFQDLTALKKRESQLLEGQRLQAIGELASGISHDFNNLLTAMIGFCDLLLRRHTPSDVSFSDIMQIKQNANRAASLVKQLLQFGRAMNPMVESVDVRSCLNELSFVLRRLLGPLVDLKMHHSRFVKTMTINKNRLEQVVMNLSINARDAMPSGGILTIKTYPMALEEEKKNFLGMLAVGDYIVIEVSDTGVGIPEKILGKIFHPFFSTKQEDKGTGLGLATVHQIMQDVEGGIEVLSTPGQGTVFRLYWPKVAEEISLEKETAQGKGHFVGTGGTILVVEDEDPVRLFTVRALKSQGYQVLDARDGAQGVLLAKKNPHIELIVSDVMMAGMDGPTLASACYQENTNLSFLFVSGYPEKDIHMKVVCPKEKVFFLSKPFSLDSLVSKVSFVLNHQRQKAS